MDKVIITAAICGAEVTKDQNPIVPYSAEELAKEAKRSVDAGAAVIHLHVRNPDGTPTQNKDVYKRAIDAINNACIIKPIIQVSTGGAVGMGLDERIEPLDCYPEMATLDLGTCNFGDEIFINDIPMIKTFAKRMTERQILPEMECFEAGHVHTALRLWKEKLLTGHMHFDFVLGVPGALNASTRTLLFMSESIPDRATWTATGIGKHNLNIAVMALGMEGNVRVGLEDTIYYSRGELANSNGQLVERVARIAGELGRQPASPDEARQILEIKQ
jgi:3-keto-5-aminohexanoate cleavage enzyme